jgi:ribosomal-protein-alanine N-acetyltransferase
MPGAIVKSGEQLTLRTLEREDLDILQRGAADPDIRHLTGNSKVRNRDDLEDTFEDENTTILLVCLDDPGESGPVGPEDIRRIGIASVAEYGRNPRLGIWLVPDVQGEGFGNEATRLLVDYVFNSYDRPAVTAKAFDYNDSSRGVLESLGFQQEGRLRQNAFLDGEYRDGLLYGLLREEWEDWE